MVTLLLLFRSEIKHGPNTYIYVGPWLESG
jgi:hypothetical protein